MAELAIAGCAHKYHRAAIVSECGLIIATRSGINMQEVLFYIYLYIAIALSSALIASGIILLLATSTVIMIVSVLCCKKRHRVAENLNSGKPGFPLHNKVAYYKTQVLTLDAVTEDAYAVIQDAATQDAYAVIQDAATQDAYAVIQDAAIQDAYAVIQDAATQDAYAVIQCCYTRCCYTRCCYTCRVRSDMRAEENTDYI